MDALLISVSGENWIVCKEEPVETLEAIGSRVEMAADITLSPSINALPIISSGTKFSLVSSYFHSFVQSLSFYFFIGLSY